MAIAATAIAGMPIIPRLWPWISHCRLSLRHKLHNLLIILVSEEDVQVFFKLIIWDSSFLGHSLKYRAIEFCILVVPFLGDQINHIEPGPYWSLETLTALARYSKIPRSKYCIPHLPHRTIFPTGLLNALRSHRSFTRCRDNRLNKSGYK